MKPIRVVIGAHSLPSESFADNFWARCLTRWHYGIPFQTGEVDPADSMVPHQAPHR